MAVKELSCGQQQLDLIDYVRALEQALRPGSNCGLSEIRSCLHAVEAHLGPSGKGNPPDVTQDPRLEHYARRVA